MEKVNTFLRSRVGMLAVAVPGVAGALALGAPAFALGTEYDPTGSLKDFANTAGNTAGPIVVAVASAMVGLVLLFWGIRFVFGLVRHGISS
jgi:hypothetical protein